jgi:hypothetical protein
VYLISASQEFWVSIQLSEHVNLVQNDHINSVIVSLGELTELKPRFLYQIIETLLPSATFHPENNPNGERLLEL